MDFVFLFLLFLTSYCCTSYENWIGEIFFLHRCPACMCKPKRVCTNTLFTSCTSDRPHGVGSTPSTPLVLRYEVQPVFGVRRWELLLLSVQRESEPELKLGTPQCGPMQTSSTDVRATRCLSCTFAGATSRREPEKGCDVC